MIHRSLLTLFTALLLGATLSAPMVVAMGQDHGVKEGAAKSFSLTPGEWSSLSDQPSDTETDEGMTPLVLVSVSTLPHTSGKALPLQPVVARPSERPPARASPACL